MEIAIPILALGGMYVISNQSSNKYKNDNPTKKNQENQENFTIWENR